MVNYHWTIQDVLEQPEDWLLDLLSYREAVYNVKEAEHG